MSAPRREQSEEQLAAAPFDSQCLIGTRFIALCQGLPVRTKFWEVLGIDIDPVTQYYTQHS